MKQTNTLPATLPSNEILLVQTLKAAKLTVMSSDAPIFYKSDCQQRLKWVVQGLYEGDFAMAEDCWADFLELARTL
jgi:hypothetical protein